MPGCSTPRQRQRPPEVEVFVSQREPEKAVSLTDALKALGLRGRDAAYLASTLVTAFTGMTGQAPSQAAWVLLRS